jgi:hypothetical protein
LQELLTQQFIHKVTEIFISELIAACLATNGINNPNLLVKWKQH